jgi:beta-N-acetylhexosaminidase
VSPRKAPVGCGAVESGEEKTRESYTPASYIDLLQVQDPNILDVRFHDGTAVSAGNEKQIAEADAVIFATRNASLSSYQKEYRLALGKKLGEKLIVVATCDPYDFLGEKDEIKNYIAIYEPTIPAFKSAVDIIFGITEPLGMLPVGTPPIQHEIRPFTNSEEDIDKLWSLWHVVFPKWPTERPRLSKLLGSKNGLHYLHDKGFCISYLMDGPQGKIVAIGVLPDFRRRGLGTLLINKARIGLQDPTHTTDVRDSTSCEIGSDFPGFWPQVPTDFAQADKNFFLHRGISFN